MKIIEVTKNTHYPPKQIRAKYWGETFLIKNPAYRLGPVEETRMTFSLSNQEIEQYGLRPEWQKSKRFGEDAVFSAILSDGVPDLEADFKPILQFLLLKEMKRRI